MNDFSEFNYNYIPLKLENIIKLINFAYDIWISKELISSINEILDK